MRLALAVPLTLLATLAVAPVPLAHAEDKLLDTFEWTYTPDNMEPGGTLTGNTVLQAGQRYRLDITGTVHLEPTFERHVPLECDGVWCHETGKPIVDDEDSRGGAITVGYDATNFSDHVQNFVRRPVAYQEEHSYEVVFKARKSDKLFMEGLGNLYQRTGKITVRLYEDDEDTLKINWAIKKRFERHGDDSVDYPTRPSEVKEPDEAKYLLEVTTPKGRPCNPKLTYRWKVDGKKADLFRRTDKVSDTDCEWQARLDTDRSHTLEVTAKWGKRRLEGDETVEYRDLLIVGLGDSAGSGEGVPLYKGFSKGRFEWENARCHRSPYSQQAIAAEQVENADKHSVVTFVHLACSGATVEEGLIGGYEGIEPDSPNLPAQVDEMYRLIGKRSVDALQVSIGVNHGEFGKVVGFCVSNDECMVKPYKDGLKMAEFVTGRLAALPASFQRLADRLAGRVLPSNVYLSHYPDLLRGDDGKLCQSIVDTKVAGVIDAGEVQWLDLYYANPLGAQINAAGVRQQWNVFQGAQAAFSKHGYCADDHWIRKLSESRVRQGDTNGAMHPNWVGHAVLGRLAGSRLKKDLVRR